MNTRATLREREGKGFDSCLFLAKCKSDVMHSVRLDTKTLQILRGNDLFIKLNRSNLFNDSIVIDDVKFLLVKEILKLSKILITSM